MERRILNDGFVCGDGALIRSPRRPDACLGMYLVGFAEYFVVVTTYLPRHLVSR